MVALKLWNVPLGIKDVAYSLRFDIGKSLTTDEIIGRAILQYAENAKDLGRYLTHKEIGNAMPILYGSIESLLDDGFLQTDGTKYRVTEMLKQEISADDRCTALMNQALAEKGIVEVKPEETIM